MTQEREIVGISKHIQELHQKIRSLAKEDTTVLILGPTGTGKELVANNIHFNSNRKGGPYEVVNCASIPDGLFESELFGHERGAFTGATAKKIGKFELADGGTILLDEIGDMKPNHQASILRVLQERTICPIQGKDKNINVRIIASTNKDLLSEIGKCRFRQDLYYRLSQAVIELEPLADRPEDVIVLTNYFIHRDKLTRKADPRVKFLLYAYEWPGNVRELENMVRNHINDFSYVERKLENGWKSIPKKDSETMVELESFIKNQKEFFGTEYAVEEDQDRFMETIEFVEKPDVDFQRYIEIYEIMTLHHKLSKNKISETLHLQRKKVYNFKEHYGFDLDLEKEKDIYMVHHPLDVYPQPKTLRNDYPDIADYLNKCSKVRK